MFTFTEKEKQFLAYSIIIFFIILLIAIFSIFAVIIFLLYSYKAQVASQHSQLLEQGIAIATLNGHVAKLETNNLLLLSHIKSSESNINALNIAFFIGTLCAAFLVYSMSTRINTLNFNIKGVNTKLTLRDQSLADHKNYLDQKANLFTDQTDVFKESSKFIFRRLHEYEDSVKLDKDLYQVGVEQCRHNFKFCMEEIFTLTHKLNDITARLDSASISNVVDNINVAIVTTPGVVEGLAAVNTVQGTVS